MEAAGSSDVFNNVRYQNLVLIEAEGILVNVEYVELSKWEIGRWSGGFEHLDRNRIIGGRKKIGNAMPASLDETREVRHVGEFTIIL